MLSFPSLFSSFFSFPFLMSRIDDFGAPCMHGFNHAIPPGYIEGLDQLDD
jgi:hypothetical protein